MFANPGPRGCLLGLGLLVLLAPPLQAAGLRNEPISPVPAISDELPLKVDLGRRLFHDVRLSADNTISCASCHRLDQAGADGLPRSPGVQGRLGTINTPTVYNSRFNLAQFWNGRSPSLRDQVAGPVHNPLEMASDWGQVVAKLQRDTAYRAKFAALYGDGISGANIADAIAAFERTLVTVDAPFDRWLLGDDQALDEGALQGYRLFKSFGCIACHQGVNVGGNMYQQMGAMGDYFGDRGGGIAEVDLGRYQVTGDDVDRFAFKVPSLRLAIRTPPYFHDGSVQEIDDAVRAMARYQLGRTMSDGEVAAIVRFLESLAGEPPRVAGQ